MALQNELEILEDLIFDALHPKNLIEKILSIEEIYTIHELLIQEREGFKRKIRKTVGKLINKNRKTAYLELHQTSLTRMMDAIMHYLLPKEITKIYEKRKPENIEDLYHNIYVGLDSMLQFLKHDYASYFNQDAKIPDGHKWRTEQLIKQTLSQVVKKLTRKVSPGFLEVICEPLKHFLLIETEYSYRELTYLLELQVYFIAITEKVPEDAEVKITERLLYLNFNSVLFFNYYVLKISDESSKKKTVSERVEYLSWQIKVINQTIVKPDAIYLRHLSPIREQLIFWIAEDLYYLDKKHQLSLNLPVNREIEKDKMKKVHVHLTVADLALGARLLLDTEVIVNINYTELMKLVAKSFRTNRQANISQQAIYNVGFEASAISKEKMKQVLMKMVRRIGEY